ncbi:hypothetical protein NPIL_584601, partial [Nephila pilipes]
EEYPVWLFDLERIPLGGAERVCSDGSIGMAAIESGRSSVCCILRVVSLNK